MDKTDNPFLATIRIPLKMSPLVACFCVIVHLISMILPWFSDLDFVIKLILSGLVLMSLAYYCYQFYFAGGKRQVTELILGCEDDWQIKMTDGTVYFGELQSSMFVHPLLVIIKLHYARHRRHFILTPEFIDADQFRRLRVRLRFPIDVKEKSISMF